MNAHVLPHGLTLVLGFLKYIWTLCFISLNLFLRGSYRKYHLYYFILSLFSSLSTVFYISLLVHHHLHHHHRALVYMALLIALLIGFLLIACLLNFLFLLLQRELLNFFTFLMVLKLYHLVLFPFFNSLSF